MDGPTHVFENGDRMPLLGLGTWKSEPGELAPAIREAVGIGYRHLDCAPIYGNEAEVGEALADLFSKGGVRREELWVTSKLWNAHHLPGDVLPALKQTLRDLRLDHLDLHLMHWPVALRPGIGLPQGPEDFLAPAEAPLSETWAAMEEAVDAGLCRHIGVSNFNPHKLRALSNGARIPPAVNQVECHPYLAQRELLDLCRAQGILLTAYSPLGSPDRPARVRKDEDPVLLEAPEIQAIAGRLEVSPAQVLLAWALQRGTSVIPKSVSPARLRQNFEAQQLKLDPSDMTAIEALDRGLRYIDGSFWCPPGSPYTREWLWEA